MKNILKHIALATTMLILAGGVVSCKKEQNNLCSYMNTRDISKTIPIINKFLSELPTEWSDKEQLWELAEWIYSSCSKVISAFLWSDTCVRIWFIENGIERLSALCISKDRPMKIVKHTVLTPEEIEKENPFIVNRPENLKPIDWENYNDVYTVHWTYYRRNDIDDPWVFEDDEKPIRVHGWVAPDGFDIGLDLGPSHFILIGDESNDHIPFIPVLIIGGSEIVDSIKEKIATADLTKKSYVRGKLCTHTAVCITTRPWGCRCIVHPRIRIYSADDIYFE